MNIRDFVSALSDGKFNAMLSELYGADEIVVTRQKVRLIDACEQFAKKYPTCDEIKVVSVPVFANVSNNPIFLSADKIMIMQKGKLKRVFISDDAPKGLGVAPYGEITEISGCFSGYSLCIAGNKMRTKKETFPDTDYGNLCRVVSEDEKKRSEEEKKALESCDVAEFFRLVNGSFSFIMSGWRTQQAVVVAKKFLGDDGAVMAENNLLKAFLPSYRADDFSELMQQIYGEGTCNIMKIRSTGVFEIVS